MSNFDSNNIISVKEVHRFVVDCCLAVRVPEKNAIAMADLLSNADYRGQYTYGLHMLESYLNQLSDRTINGAIMPEILKQTPSTAWVDGRNGLGPVVGNFCIDLAMSKAKLTGLGWVCVRNSNNYGVSSWYAQRAMDKGFIGISMTNGKPYMVPTRSKVARVGANTIAVAAPANEDQFIANISLTGASPGKIELKYRAEEPLPHGWARDFNGNFTTDPAVALQANLLMPLGGDEITGGYKGYALAAMVDIFASVMAGQQTETDRKKNKSFGHVFGVIDPNCFTNSFQDRLEDFNSILRNTEPLDLKRPVMIPGDKEREHMMEVDKYGGLSYLPRLLESCESLAKRFEVTPLRFV